MLQKLIFSNRRAESYSVYDAIVHDPSPKEIELLAAIPFTDKLVYRYKIINETLYYSRENLESQPPLVKSVQGSESQGSLDRLETQVPTGSLYTETSEREWTLFLLSIQPPQRSVIFRDQLIVDEHMFRGLPTQEKVIIIGKTYDFLAHRSYWAALDKLQLEKESEHAFWSQCQYFQRKLGDASGTLFMSFFFGIAFLVMLASSLMVKTLSGSSKAVDRYERLRTIGHEHKGVFRSIYHEILLILFFPVVVGLLQIVFGINLFSLTLRVTFYHVWISNTLFAALYFLYYFLTLKLYRNIVVNYLSKPKG